MHWSKSSKRFDSTLMSLLSVKKVKREFLRVLFLVLLEWLPWISAAEHACSSTESGYWPLAMEISTALNLVLFPDFFLTYLTFCLRACCERNKCLTHLFMSISRFCFGDKTESTWQKSLIALCFPTNPLKLTNKLRPYQKPWICYPFMSYMCSVITKLLLLLMPCLQG